MASHPTLHVVYATATGGDVYQFSADSTTGALSTLAAKIADASHVSPNTLAVTPNGKFLYVVDNGAGANGEVRAYTLDSTTGALTQGAVYTAVDGSNTPNAPYSIAFTFDSKYAFVGYFGSSSVCAFSISPSTGALTQVGTSCVNSALSVFQIAVSSAGNELYACGIGSGIDSFSISSLTGALSSDTHIALPGTATAACRSMARAGNYLIGAANTGQVSSYLINANGSLGSPNTITLTGFTNSSNAIDGIGVSTDATYVGLSDANENIVFSVKIGASGSLTQSNLNFTTNMNGPTPLTFLGM